MDAPKLKPNSGILAWCFSHGRRPSEREIHVWNEFMRKRGWRDDETALLERLKAKQGFPDQTDIQTFFDLQELDESYHRPHPLRPGPWFPHTLIQLTRKKL